MLKNISQQLSKWLVIGCVFAAVFCALMLAWFLLFPVENYAAQLEVAQAEVESAQEQYAQIMSEVNAQIESVSKEKEALLLEESKLIQSNTEQTEATTELQTQVDLLNNLPQTVLQVRQTYGEKIRQLEDLIMEGKTDMRICYLTFDDGPNSMTADILAKLEAHEAYATFFTIGANTAPKQEENLRAEMLGGHTVANHTYSHSINGSLYRSMEEFQKQVLKQDEFVYNATGFHMDLFRFPSGSVMCPFLEEAELWLEENGYQWVDWNASAWDAGFHALTAKARTIYTNMYSSSKHLPIAVILGHDFNPATCAALDELIPDMKSDGYVFLPLLPQSHMLDEPLPVV